MREYPNVALPVAYEIIKRLSSFVRNIDFALDWMVIDAGKSLYRYYYFLHIRRISSIANPEGATNLSPSIVHVHCIIQLRVMV